MVAGCVALKLLCLTLLHVNWPCMMLRHDGARARLAVIKDVSVNAPAARGMQVCVRTAETAAHSLPFPYTCPLQYPDQGALDKHLLRALSNVFSLVDCPPAQLSSATCSLLLDVLQHRLRDVAARSELTTILVAAYAARKDLETAVRLASSLDAAAAAAMEADAGAAGGPAIEPMPAAAAAQGAAGPGGAGLALGVDGGLAGGGVGAGPLAVAGQAGQRLAEMWRGVAAAAIRAGDAGVLLTALPRLNTSWLLGPVDEDLGQDAAAVLQGPVAGRAVALPRTYRQLEKGPGSGSMVAVASGADIPLDGAAATGPGVSAPTGPSTVWQAVCGVLLRSGHRASLEFALLQLLGERRRVLGGHTDQRALLESTARAMISNGYSAEALVLARRLGGGYSAGQDDGCGTSNVVAGGGEGAGTWAVSAPPPDVDSSAGTSPSVRPCWSMLNVILEGFMASGQLQLVLQELSAAGAAQSRAAGLVVHAAAGRLRQSLLADVLVSLTEAGRLDEAVQLLRVLRGGEGDGPLLPTPFTPMDAMAAGGSGTAAPQRSGLGTGRTTRLKAVARRNRGNSAAAAPAVAAVTADAEESVTEVAVAIVAATAAATTELPVVADGGQGGDMALVSAGTSGHGLGELHWPQPQYNRLLLESGSDEEAGQAAAPPQAASGNVSGRGSVTTLGCGSCARGASFEAALTALVKALLKRASSSGSGVTGGAGGSAAASDSTGGSGAVSCSGGGGASSGSDLLGDWLEVCKAWPLGLSRDTQLDSLAKQAMDKGRDLEIALQAGWLLGEASQQVGGGWKIG